MIINNNPGNLRYYGDLWRGLIPRNYYIGEFCRFETMYDGLRAMTIDILGDIAEGKNTIRKLITEYAPNNENNTALYIQQISEWTSIHPDTNLTGWESGQLNVIYNMIKKETGQTLPMLFVEKVYDDVIDNIYDPADLEPVVASTKTSLFIPAAIAAYIILNN